MRNLGFLQLRTTRTGIIIFFLVLTLSVVGASYASWVDRLGIKSRILTGSFSMAFEKNKSYAISIVDANGKPVGGSINSDNISCTLATEDKLARLYFTGTLALEELAQPNRLLMLRYPLVLGEDSTVQKITAYQADIGQPAQEQLNFMADSLRFTINGYECTLPARLQSVTQPLQWDVYRSVEVENDDIMGVALLRLRPESISDAQSLSQLTVDAAELPPELVEQLAPEENGTAGPLSAEITTVYSFSLPLYIEQGH